MHLVILGSFIGVGYRFDDAPALLVVGYLLLAAMLVTVSAIDIACFRLPDRIVLPTLAVSRGHRRGRVAARGPTPSRIGYAVAGAAMYFGILLVFHLISPGGMGFGDVKLAAVMGLYLGWLALGYAPRSCWCCGRSGVGARGRLGRRHRSCSAIQGRNRRTAIPFGPYLAFGTMLVVLLDAAPGHPHA